MTRVDTGASADPRVAGPWRPAPIRRGRTPPACRFALAGARPVAALGHQGQEGVQAVGVEVDAAVGLHVGEGAVGRPGRPVGAVGGERVPHVGHGHDAGGQGDLLPGQAVGVAGAVVALVVLADHGQGVAERRGPPDDVGADDRVLLDPGPLLVAEGPGLFSTWSGMPTLPTSCR
jgi:hypothetical protein